MRYIKLLKVLCLLSAFVLLASCGGGTGGGASTGTSTITIAIGGTGQLAVIEQEEKTLFAKLFNFISPDDALAGTLPPPGPDLCFIPPDVHRVVFNISGLGMAPISREVIVGTQCPIIEEFEVPNGSQRIFSADEYSVSGAHLYTGATVQNISGADHVQIIMRNAGTCSRNFTFEISPGTYSLYFFQATSLTESVDAQLTGDQEAQLSLIDSNGGSIVCDPVCGSTLYDTNLNITHAFTAPDFYGIKVGNFGNAVGNYSLDVTITGDETVCDSIVSSPGCFTDTDCPPNRMCVEGFCELMAEPVCGDGNLDPGEQCDDGNTLDGDGCSANCTLEIVETACTRYVAGDGVGNDGGGENDCVLGSDPCRSIDNALWYAENQRISDVETICVDEGTYNNASGEFFPLALPANTGILCAGANHSSIIEVVTQPSVWAIEAHGPGTSVDGCRITTIDGNNISGIKDSYYESPDVLDFPMTIHNNLIDPWRTAGSAIDITNPGSVVLGNTLVGANPSTAFTSYGLFVRNAATITGNNISGYGVGVNVLDATNAVNNPTISQNSIYCNTFANLFTSEATPATAGGLVTPVDARENSWNSDQLSVVPVSSASPSGCGGADICYLDYAPVPLYDPWNAPNPGCNIPD
ncbi:MAG: hypothetical protein AMK70_09725 [Nitrospira bacterium SG8_35_1]|nr:MAG: hypothetical protein AMK70_09725 [Nitrospira bacterium SG8_35_1]